MRREDLLKPDIISELILVGAVVVLFAILALTLIVALMQASAPV